ncbi:putative Longin-like domain-containing protein [Rosa chinensis]|uniref:Putative Longin-like domain-containing protein n=1 Tax=Rosa chinensis TaxID=74649 RepID=A0A2P6QDR6_ROSCH|nr:putative Longin-like domain-containing protein [Rosa chinensis]
MALLVIKCNPEGSNPVILANAFDTSHFGYFQRSSVRSSSSSSAAQLPNTPLPGQRQSVKPECLFSPVAAFFFFLRIVVQFFFFGKE